MEDRKVQFFCKRHWPTVFYAFVSHIRKSSNMNDWSAEDMTQDFFMRKISNGEILTIIKRIEEGNTGSLYASIKNFFIDAYRRKGTKKNEPYCTENLDDHAYKVLTNTSTEDDFCKERIEALRIHLIEKYGETSSILKVFDLMAEGAAPREISEELNLKISSVYTMRSTIYSVGKDFLKNLPK